MLLKATLPLETEFQNQSFYKFPLPKDFGECMGNWGLKGGNGWHWMSIGNCRNRQPYILAHQVFQNKIRNQGILTTDVSEKFGALLYMVLPWG